jgi:hypothetical protein
LGINNRYKNKVSTNKLTITKADKGKTIIILTSKNNLQMNDTNLNTQSSTESTTGNEYQVAARHVRSTSFRETEPKTRAIW